MDEDPPVRLIGDSLVRRFVRMDEGDHHPGERGREHNQL